MGVSVQPMFPDGGTDAAKIQSFPVSTVDPASGQVLVYNSTTRQWEPSSAMAPLSGGTFTGNVTLNGTANTAPNQTAASGSSLMTRDLVYASIRSKEIKTYGGGELPVFTTYTGANPGSTSAGAYGLMAVAPAGGIGFNIPVPLGWGASVLVTAGWSCRSINNGSPSNILARCNPLWGGTTGTTSDVVVTLPYDGVGTIIEASHTLDFSTTTQSGSVRAAVL